MINPGKRIQSLWMCGNAFDTGKRRLATRGVDNPAWQRDAWQPEDDAATHSCVQHPRQRRSTSASGLRIEMKTLRERRRQSYHSWHQEQWHAKQCWANLQTRTAINGSKETKSLSLNNKYSLCTQLHVNLHAHVHVQHVLKYSGDNGHVRTPGTVIQRTFYLALWHWNTDTATRTCFRKIFLTNWNFWITFKY